MNTQTSTPSIANAQRQCQCTQGQILVWQNHRRCIACGAYLEDNNHVATYYVVTRTLQIVLNHGFVGAINGNDGRIIKEMVFAKSQSVAQERLEFQLPTLTGERPVRCSVRWFRLDQKADYQYLNKASSRAVNVKTVPHPVRTTALQLAIAHMQPGSLRFSEINLAGDFEGRKFIRMEQSYALDEATAHDTSLILRVEFSW